jgi:hypothetical protein
MRSLKNQLSYQMIRLLALRRVRSHLRAVAANAEKQVLTKTSAADYYFSATIVNATYHGGTNGRKPLSHLQEATDGND